MTQADLGRITPSWLGRTARMGLLVGAAMAMVGCDSAREAFGLSRNQPDEFRIAARAPLSVPPTFDLRPPAPGAARPQETAPRVQAVEALTGRGGGAGQVSEAEAALLTQAAPRGIAPDIRRTVDLESQDLLRADQTFVDTLLFWRETPPPGRVVDPAAEAQRLARNEALGQPIDAGEVPTIERREGTTLLDDIAGWIPF